MQCAAIAPTVIRIRRGRAVHCGSRRVNERCSAARAHRPLLSTHSGSAAQSTHSGSAHASRYVVHAVHAACRRRRACAEIVFVDSQRSAWRRTAATPTARSWRTMQRHGVQHAASLNRQARLHATRTVGNHNNHGACDNALPVPPAGCRPPCRAMRMCACSSDGETRATSAPVQTDAACGQRHAERMTTAQDDDWEEAAAGARDLRQFGRSPRPPSTKPIRLVPLRR